MDAHMETSPEMCRSVLLYMDLEALMRLVSPCGETAGQRVGIGDTEQ